MIANNKNRENGWASQIYGRVVEVNGQSFGQSFGRPCIMQGDDKS